MEEGQSLEKKHCLLLGRQGPIHLSLNSEPLCLSIHCSQGIPQWGVPGAADECNSTIATDLLTVLVFVARVELESAS